MKILRKVIINYTVSNALPSEHSDVIWLRNLLPGSVISYMVSSYEFSISATTLLYFYFMVKNIRLL